MVRIDGAGKDGTLLLTLRGTLTLKESAAALSQLYIPFTSEAEMLCACKPRLTSPNESDKNSFLNFD